jgi:hypothetical protein
MRAGCPACCPPGRGPRRAHKLTAEIVAFLAVALADDPGLRPGELARRVEESFGITVHPRSVERALERARRPKS